MTSRFSSELFTAAAFRDYTGKAGSLINLTEGLLPDQPKAVISPPSPAVFAGIRNSWERLRKRARVLRVLDVSGAMGDSVGSEGATKLDLAKKAAASAVAQLAPDDLLSLWIFSTQQDHEKPYRELVPFATARENIAIVRSKIADLQPDGGTGLYATVRAASAALASSYDPQRINAIVVLTDRRNEFPADNTSTPS